jgi:hypothetical protein
MFCPKCAAELVLHHGEMACLRGKMPLSARVAAVLQERFGNHVPSPRHSVVTPIAGAFYCPGCGIPLNDQMHCPECQLSIADLRFDLTELHPHKTGSSTRRRGSV